MTRTLLILPFLALTACGPRIPDSSPTYVGDPVDIGRGVGFGGAATPSDRREAGDAVPTEEGISSEELSAAGLPSAAPVVGNPIDAEPSGGPASVNDPVPGASVNNPGISDEQSFEAVTARESIESDAERIERARAEYRVIEAEPVPIRGGDDGPNIVQYALSTSNQVGEAVYRRGGLFQERRYRRACAGFASPDLAQEEFLARGGPERDRLGVDPDGDGFACSWNPAPFRAARG